MKNFNYCSTLRGPSHSLAAGILDETGVYKNSYRKLQKELGLHCLSIQHLDQVSGTRLFLRERLNWPEIGIRFTGEPAKNKKQAEKNAAMAAWTSLKLLTKETANSS